MKLTVDLTIHETNLLLNTLGQEYDRIRVSKAKSWRPSTKAMAMSELNRIRNKIVEAEYEAKKAAGAFGASSEVVRGDGVGQDSTD